MLIDMFGEQRVGAALSMLGNDLQRAFVVLLETDGQDDDNAYIVDDEEWDYENPNSAFQTKSLLHRDPTRYLILRQQLDRY